MIDAYEIGIRLALENGVSEGLAVIRRDLTALDAAIAHSAAGLEALQQLASVLLRPALPPMRPPAPPPAPLPVAEPAQPDASAPAVGTRAKQSPPVRVEATFERPPAAPAALLPPTPPVRPSELSSVRPSEAPARPAIASVPGAEPVQPTRPRQTPKAAGAGMAPVPLPANPPATGTSAPISKPIVSAPLPARPTPRLVEPTSSLPIRPAASVSPARPSVPVPNAGREVLPGPVSPPTLALPAAPLAPARPARTETRDASAGQVSLDKSVGATSPRPSAPIVRLKTDSMPSQLAQAATKPADSPATRVLRSAAHTPVEARAPRRHAAPPSPLRSAEHGKSFRGQPDQPSTGHGGDVYLEGAAIGRWINDHLARSVIRPVSGSTGFDPRLSPVWPGASIGS